jgi:hypothetical protein
LTLYLGKINYRNKYLSKIGKACLEGTLNPKFPSCTSLLCGFTILRMVTK